MPNLGGEKPATSRPQDLSERKSMIMVLGNSKDIDTLLEMLQHETEPELILQIITILGAIGDRRAIEPLSLLTKTSTHEKIKKRSKEAIMLIQSLNKY